MIMVSHSQTWRTHTKSASLLLLVASLCGAVSSCKPQQQFDTTTTTNQSTDSDKKEENLTLVALVDTVIWDSSVEPAPFILIPVDKRCFVAKGTKLEISQAPEAESDEAFQGIVELKAFLQAMVPPDDSAFSQDRFANSENPCPFAKAWISMASWKIQGLTAETDPIADIKDSSNEGFVSGNVSSGFNPRYPFLRRLPTCGEAGGGAGAFKSMRSNGSRYHAGCDVYGSVGTGIVAIDDGIVVGRAYSFYCATDAIEIRHSGGRIVRYGEIKPGSASRFSAGSTVQKGEVIAQIGKLSCYHQSMLHFELFSGAVSGPLTTGSGGFQRRSDLQNPTELLINSGKNL